MAQSQVTRGDDSYKIKLHKLQAALDNAIKLLQRASGIVESLIEEQSDEG